MSDKIIRILLIEDNPNDTRVIRQMLADTATADPIAPAFDLTRARRLSSGLRRLAAERFDALLLDLSLPDSQGLDTFVKAQAQAPQTPIIVLSDLEKVALEAVQKGAQDYLVKGEASASTLVRAIRYATEHKQLEAMLSDSQAELAAVVENAPLIMLIVDQDVLVQKVNRAAIRFAGHLAEEMIGRRGGEVLRCLHNLDDPRGCGFGPSCKMCTVRRTVTDTIEKGIRHAHVQARLTVVEEEETKDLALLISTAPLTIAEKPMVLLYIEDITEHKQAEEALKERFSTLRSIIDSTDALIFSLDRQYRYTNFNEGHAAVMKALYGAEIQAGHNMLDYMTVPEDREIAKRNLDRALTGEQLVEETYSGEELRSRRCFRVSHSPIKAEAGEVIGVAVLAHDIAEHKRAEKALGESEEKYRFITEKMTDAVWLMDMEFKPTFISPSGTRMFGHTPEELQALSLNELLTPESFEFAMKTIATELSPERLASKPYERSVTVELEFRRKDGSPLCIESTITLLRDSEGHPTGFMGVGRDITERKRAEEAVRESEARHRAIVEAFDGLIYICSQDYRVELMNERLLERTGYDGTGELCYKVLHDLDSVCPWCVNDRVFAGETVRWEIQSPKDNHWYYVVNTPIYHADGSMSKQAMILDITERKQAEEALRQSEERFRALYEDNPSMYFMVDAQGTVLSVNPFGADQLGYTAEELIGQSVLNVFYPDDREAVQQQLTACLEHPGQVAHWEFRKVHQDGSLLWVQEAARAVQGADSRPVVLIVCEDVTERRRAEEEREHLLVQVQEQARRVQEIMDTVPEGVLLLDANCRVLLANPLGQRDLATLANAQVGDILALLGDRSLAELLTSPPKGLWHEVATTSRFFQAIARPIEDDPTPKGWVLVIRDVTQQREVEQRIQQQERLAALGQLAAGIAHDFNNILAAISLYAGMLLRIADLPSLVYERLKVVNQQAQCASDLVQQVMDFSRHAVLKRGAMDLLMFLKEQINLLKRMLPESIKVKLVYDEGEYTVNADPTRMQQVVMNLATNARDAMPQGGRLSFGLERIHVRDRASAPLPDMEAGDWICVTITDTGAGIPQDVLPHIFEPFFTTKAEGRGTGLGLAQVYGIIEQHEGVIDVKAEIDAGTTFLLYLPALVVPQPPLSPPRIEQLPQGHGETVLVVEDDAVARQAVVSSLETLGYQVLQATNGLEALDIFEQHADKIELALSDVVMPEMGGRSLFHALRQRAPAVRVVLLTGYPLKDTELEDLRTLGLREWALKPLSLEQLAQITARALGNVEDK